jgi:hypothetical protein
LPRDPSARILSSCTDRFYVIHTNLSSLKAVA